ncbi:MAG: hypothetical protein FJX23_00520 [Alphaproteobacteria bacterium]|nr:hypothetical protein [Alphaproteobacteria bacterium]
MKKPLPHILFDDPVSGKAIAIPLDGSAPASNSAMAHPGAVEATQEAPPPPSAALLMTEDPFESEEPDASDFDFTAE